MKKNMGSVDKTIRLLLALVIVILAFTKVITGVWAIVLLILALVFVVTSLLGLCPLYLPFGINTNKKKE
jgi:Inner membrane protein YgaP-like, transmembrane domain